MFHRDAQHTGLFAGTPGNITPALGPVVRWKYRVTDPAPVAPLTDTNPVYYRWTSTFPLADLNGDGKPEVIVTTPDGTSDPDRVIALQDTPGRTPPVRAMWIYTAPTTYAYTDTRKGFDTYSPVLADVDGDGLPDVIFSTKDGHVRALKGTTGLPIWDFNLQRRTEDGPMLADLDGDGKQEVIITTDCASLASTYCPGANDRAMLYVLPVSPTGTITPLWSLAYPYKMDSSEPAIADLDPTDGTSRKAIVLGTWGGKLLITWRSPSNAVFVHTLDLRTLDVTGTLGLTPVIRTSPLVWDFGEGQTAVFGWLPTDERAGFARISAVGLSAGMASGAFTFTPRWTTDQFDDWKSSPALLPVDGGPPLVVTGYGLAYPADGQSGPVGECRHGTVFGGIVALTYQGHVAWHHDFAAQGNVRASAAVADLNGDGHPDVVLPVGCYGNLYAYSNTGDLEWTLPLGPRSQGSPSIGDLDGDGNVEIVLSSYDGNVWVLDGGRRAYVPLALRD
jgi:outer membrane protein assembly factor BamB